jgi:hypothetical protein
VRLCIFVHSDEKSVGNSYKMTRIFSFFLTSSKFLTVGNSYKLTRIFSFFLTSSKFLTVGNSYKLTRIFSCFLTSNKFVIEDLLVEQLLQCLFVLFLKIRCIFVTFF